MCNRQNDKESVGRVKRVYEYDNVHQLSDHNDHRLSFRLGEYTFHDLYLPPVLSTAQCTEWLENRLRIDDHTIIIGDLNALPCRYGDRSTKVRGTRVLDP